MIINKKKEEKMTKNSIIFLASAILQFSYQNYDFLLISTSLFLFGVFIFYTRRIPFALRSFVGCSMFFFVGLLIFYKIGPISSGLFWFFLFSIFNASFNGTKGVVFTNIMIGLTVLFFILMIIA